MANLKDLEEFITENFTIKEEEKIIDAAIRLLCRYKEQNPQSETEEIVNVEKGKHGRTSQIYELKNKDTGELISKREEMTSYYKTGEINIIKQKWFDGEGNLLKERAIKHFRDGRQPIVERSEE